jgi:hypothetical protein
MKKRERYMRIIFFYILSSSDSDESVREPIYMKTFHLKTSGTMFGHQGEQRQQKQSSKATEMLLQ